ncbi:hypothetical protein McanCB49686_006173 [Microsporum canis]
MQLREISWMPGIPQGCRSQGDIRVSLIPAAAALRRNSYTYFAVNGTAAEALRPRPHPSLAAFLDAATLPLHHYYPSGNLFFYACSFNYPQYLFDNNAADLQDTPVDSLVNLYDGGMNIEAGGVVGSLPGEPGLFNCEKFGCWEWRPYSDAQVGTCIAAWDRLCETIEARISSSTTGSAVDNNNRHDSEPSPVPPAVLDAALVSDPGFARAFLTRARRPLFHRIAPGLVLPAMDEAGFTIEQPYTSLPRS